MYGSRLLLVALFLLHSPFLVTICFLSSFAVTQPMGAMPPGPYIGDNVVPEAVMIYDQTRLINAAPSAVWPWAMQVGKGRGGVRRT